MAVIIPGTHLNFVIKYKSRSISIEIITDSCITVLLVIKPLCYVLRTTVLKKIFKFKDVNIVSIIVMYWPVITVSKVMLVIVVLYSSVYFT